MFNLIRLVIVGVLIYLVYRLVKGLFLSPGGKRGKLRDSQVKAVTGEDLVEDPNCRVYVPLSQAYKATLDGRTEYFCSEKCFEQYKAKCNVK